MINSEKKFLKAKDIHLWLGISLRRAYKMIKDCNKELAKRGIYTQEHMISRKALVAFLDIEDDFGNKEQ